MELLIVKVGYLKTNCYVLKDNHQCLVIDPGDDYFAIKRAIGSCQVAGILLTHHHDDHTGALHELLSDYPVTIYDKSNVTEQEYQVASFHFSVIFTPGHTADSVTYYFYLDQMMFTGDFLFKDTVGRWDLETGNEQEMKKSIEKIKNYKDDIKVYPGHEDITELGYEKEHNPYF